MSPSLANRLRIGFAIGFAVLTAMAVIGVGRFIQQRQDFEDAIARSYQVEMAARVRFARGDGGKAARATVAAQATAATNCATRSPPTPATPRCSSPPA